MKSQLLLKTFILLAILLIMVDAYADVQDPERTQGLIAPAPQGEHELVFLNGPGKFVSAEIRKKVEELRLRLD